MKVNKYIIGMFVATATFFVSCNTDNEGDIYNSTTMGVTFATGTQSVSFPSTGYEGFDVEVLRAKSSEATTINLSATLVVGLRIAERGLHQQWVSTFLDDCLNFSFADGQPQFCSFRCD